MRLLRVSWVVEVGILANHGAARRYPRLPIPQVYHPQHTKTDSTRRAGAKSLATQAKGYAARIF